MERQHLYQIYTKHERYAYFVPQIAPQLRRYIHQQIPDNLPLQVLATAQSLVDRVRQLPLER